MSGVPVETVVELLMENCSDDYSDSLGGSWQEYSVAGLSGTSIRTGTRSELRHKLRDYLSTLVPKPVNLSECEEDFFFEVEYAINAYREGEEAFAASDDRYLGYAKNLKVICPAERGDE